MEHLSISALLYCSDAQLLCTVDRSFNEFNVAADICLNQPDADSALNKKEFDLLGLDLDEPGATDVMASWANRGPNASKLVIAFARQMGTMKEFQGRIHFMLPKPLNSSMLGKTLKVAEGMVAQKRRAGFRQSVNLKATVNVVEDGAKYKITRATLLDLSTGGVCMRTEPAVSKGASVNIDFLIPGTSNTVHANGTIVWSESTGIAGVRFNSIPTKEMDRFKSWLDEAAMNATIKLTGAPAER